jgi:pimeloyl-ACP methyl ester carboxylesterase
MVKKYKSAEGGRKILETYDALLKLWAVDIQEEDVQTPYGSTHLIMAGDPANPPLVLFHGVGDDSALMWLLNAKPLAERFRIIAVDTMGGPGKSEPNEAYFKSFDQAKWIDAILDAKSLEKVYMAGVSNGAYLTQLYTAKRPERVIKSVCMSGSVAVKGMKSPMWRMMKVFLPEALFPSEKNVIRLLKKLCGDSAAIESVITQYPEFLKHYICLLKYFNNQSMFPHKITGFDDAEIAIVREKARILIGACDGLAAGSESYDLLKQYNMNHRVVENAGHALNMEQPELVNAEIIDFLLG